MSHFMSPCLLACALGLVTVGSLGAATAPSASERDQQALAVKQLVMKGMRLPALHQIDEFKAAGYPDEGGWVEKVLREAYLLRFLSELPPPVPAGTTPAQLADPKQGSNIDPKLQKEVEALTKELDAAAKGNTLPAIAKTIRGGGGNSIERLVNELGRFINPTMPKPLVEAGPEKRQAATNLAEVLRKAMDEDYKKSFAKVKEHMVLEKPMWDLDDKSPEYKRLVSESVDMRIDALQSLYMAILGLREVSFRGAEFGIPEAATATTTFLKTFFTDHKDTLNQWDFEWGEFNPFIREYANVLLGEAARLGVKDCKEEDVETGLQAVMDFDVRSLKNGGELIEAYKLKLGAWSNMLRFRLELTTPRAYNKGLKVWDDFLDRAKMDPLLRLGGSPKLNVELGQLYILAARLFHAKDENAAANALLGELIAQKPQNPLAGNAKAWLTFFNFTPSGSGGAWSASPLATDPATAINLARAFLQEANATVDPLRQRSHWLNAAVALRNAVLGLNGASDKVLIEFGPSVYDLYASALYKLGMRQHAAVVAVEGSRLFANYLDALKAAKKPNPWFLPGTTNWDESFTSPRKLGQDAGYYASNLGNLDKNMQRITEDATAALFRISPTDVGAPQKWQEIIVLMESGDFAGALSKADAFIKEYPEQSLKVFSAMVSIRQKWIDKLVKEGGHADEVKRLQDEGAVKNKEVLAKLDEEQGKTPAPTPERQKLIDGARSAVLGAQIDGMVTAKKYIETMDLVVPMLLKAPPSDESLAARMLRLLCKAASEYNTEATAGDKAKDIPALQANWKRYSDIYRCAQKMLPKLRNHGVDSEMRAASIYLANVFAAVSNQVNTLQRPSASPLRESAPTRGGQPRLRRPLRTVDRRQDPAGEHPVLRQQAVGGRCQGARRAPLPQVPAHPGNNDSELEAFQKDAQADPRQVRRAVLVRAEFKKYWDEIDDLAWDPPEWIEAYNKGLPAGADAARRACRLLQGPGKKITRIPHQDPDPAEAGDGARAVQGHRDLARRPRSACS
jgi:hypothetical protein